MTKIDKICESEGLTLEELIEDRGYDSIVPGICNNCDNIEEVEPDCIDGWCSECQTQSVQSFMILLGVI